MSAEPDRSLSLEERSRLTYLEQQVIKPRMTAFVEVGNALMEIKDARLYREQYGSFEEYCNARWEMGRQRAYQLIAAAELSTTVDIENEGQARELAPIRNDPVRVAAVWNATKRRAKAEGAKVTAARIRREREQGSDRPERSANADLAVLHSAAHELVRRLHDETECGRDGKHWEECERLCAALGIKPPETPEPFADAPRLFEPDERGREPGS